MKKSRLPSTRSAAWPGGFAIETPKAVLSVAAAHGSVIAGGERLYLLRPGATRWVMREVPPDMGDAVAVAVDPRRRGRFVIAGMHALAILDGESLAIAQFPDDYEFEDLGWERPDDDGPSPLLIGTDTGLLLRLMPGASSFEELDLPPLRKMATDDKGRLALAWFDEKEWTLDVRVHEPDSSDYVEHHVEAPACMGRVYLAVTGGAVAVAVEGQEVWMTRRAMRGACTRVEGLTGGPIVFEGPDGNSALFGTAVEDSSIGLMRVDANGTTTRIGELEVPESEKLYSRVQELAWDGSRKTLWAAAGKAGVISSTAPGAPLPAAGALS